MSRILDFTFSPEEAVVSRVLILVHRAVDDHLPYAQEAGRQFTKTVFSSDDDPTGLYKVTVSDEAQIPPPPPATPPPPLPRISVAQKSEIDPPTSAPIPPPPPPKARPKASGGRSSSKPQPISRTRPKSTNYAASEAYPVDSIINQPDWISRVTAFFLLLGIAVLVYVLMV